MAATTPTTATRATMPSQPRSPAAKVNASRAIMAAAERPEPTMPSRRPRSDEGYMLDQSRCCMGAPSDIAVQKPNTARPMRIGCGATMTSSRPAEAAARKIDRRAGVCGPMRPASRPMRLARKGRAASAARPIEPMPPCRATAGSREPTTATLAPMPVAADRSSSRLRCRAVGRGITAWESPPNASGGMGRQVKEHLEQVTARPAR